MTVREYITNNSNIVDYDASRQNLEYLNGRNKSFLRVTFDGSCLKNADFTGSTLTDCSFVGCSIIGMVGENGVIKNATVGDKLITVIGDEVAIGCRQANVNAWRAVANRLYNATDVDTATYFTEHGTEVAAVVEDLVCQYT